MDGRRGIGVNLARLAALAAWLAALAGAPAAAALPDPVQFGVAIETGNLRAARKWLDEGLAPDFMADRIGSGLMIAAWEGNLELMALFVERGARIDLANDFDEVALQLAAWKGRLAAVRWLIERGAAVNRPPRHWSALHYAVFAGHRDVAELLIARGADVNARSTNGSTVLMMAAREGHEELAGALIAAGADPRPANDAGESALVWAMRHRNFRIARLVATPAEFAQAAKAPPASFGTPVRSAPAPVALSELLRQLRVAEAEGRPTEALRRRFADAVTAFRREAEPMAIRGGKLVRTERPRALVITAGRGAEGGERAELSYDRDAGRAGAAALPTEVPDLVRAIDAAKARGRPTEALREALREALARLREAPPAAPR